MNKCKPAIFLPLMLAFAIAAQGQTNFSGWTLVQLKTAAARYNMPAAFAVYERLLEDGNPISRKEADYWLTVAANGGLLKAQLVAARQLGGNGIQYLQMAARRNSPEAVMMLGDAYRYGRVPGQDPRNRLADAFPQYLRAAQLGWKPAMTAVAFAYSNGEGTARNTDEAVRWFATSEAYEDAGHLETNMRHDVEALKWYRVRQLILERTNAPLARDIAIPPYLTKRMNDGEMNAADYAAHIYVSQRYPIRRAWPGTNSAVRIPQSALR